MIAIGCVLGLAYVAHGVLVPLNTAKAVQYIYQYGQYGYPTLQEFQKRGVIIVEPTKRPLPTPLLFKQEFDVYVLNQNPKWEAFGELKYYAMKINRFGKVKPLRKMTVGAYDYDEMGYLILPKVGKK
ncbi:MAG: hypothetical protein COA43_10865 [Robiginitomaculum sp.]|nr:MAG: hypothetical protein COA43_10865 [Robiginitomaculum sp.]